MSTPRPWFKAKTYGWGWGLALTWQGWLVYAIYAVSMMATAAVLSPSKQPGLFTASVVLLTAALVGVCALKGEKPRWRSGR